MADERRMPGMAGITSYDVNPEKVKFKPVHVVGIISFVVVLEAVMFFGFPI